MARLAHATLLVLAVVLAGCGSKVYRSLEPARELEAFAPLVAEFEEAPPRKTLVETRGPEEVPLDVAVHETGDGTADRVIVFLHGVLSDHTTWRYVAGSLRDQGDLMLVDLPGSGASEIRVPAKMHGHGDEAYDTESMAYRVLEAIDARLEARPAPPASIAIVAHSHGTLLTMRLLSDERIGPDDRDYLPRVDRLILIAPIDVALSFPPPTLGKVASTPGFVFSLGAATGVLKRQVAKGSVAAAGGVERTPRESVDRIIKILGDPEQRKVAQAVLRNVVPSKRLNGASVPDWDRIEPLEEQIASLGAGVESPRVLLISGTRDRTAPHAMAWKLASRLENTELLALRGVGHSPALQAPRSLGETIEHFIERGTVGDLEGAEEMRTTGPRAFVVGAATALDTTD